MFENNVALSLIHTRNKLREERVRMNYFAHHKSQISIVPLAMRTIICNLIQKADLLPVSSLNLEWIRLPRR